MPEPEPGSFEEGLTLMPGGIPQAHAMQSPGNVSLSDIIAGSFFETGRWRGNLSLEGKLPPWAQPLAKQFKAEGIDPWQGVAAGLEDNPVYMGSKTKTEKRLAPPSQRGREASPAFGGELAKALGVKGREGDPGEDYHKEPGEFRDVETTTSKVLSVKRALDLVYKWDEEKFAEVQERMRNAGMPADSFDDVLGSWEYLVTRASNYFTATKGEKQLTPWDVLEMMKRENGLAEDGSGGAGQLDPNRTSTHVARSVTEITEGQAWSVMQDMVSQMLGRDPTDEELREYVYRMNHMAASNPSISKTITKYKNGEAVSSNTHTDPGFTSQDMAQAMYEEAQADPDYAEYQSATTYFNALLSALGPLGG